MEVTWRELEPIPTGSRSATDLEEVPCLVRGVVAAMTKTRDRLEITKPVGEILVPNTSSG